MAAEGDLGTLVVVALKAQNLIDRHSFYKQDAYAEISLNGEKKRTRVEVKGGQHPIWDDEFRFQISKNTAAKFRTLEVSCWAKEHREDELLGRGKIDISDTLRTGEFDDWIKLDIDGSARGEVYLEMTFYSAKPRPPGQPQKQQALTPPTQSNIVRRPSKLSPSERLWRPPQKVTPPGSAQGRSPKGKDAPLPKVPQGNAAAKPAQPGVILANTVTGPVPGILKPGGPAGAAPGKNAYNRPNARPPPEQSTLGPSSYHPPTQPQPYAQHPQGQHTPPQHYHALPPQIRHPSDPSVPGAYPPAPTNATRPHSISPHRHEAPTPTNATRPHSNSPHRHGAPAQQPLCGAGPHYGGAVPISQPQQPQQQNHWAPASYPPQGTSNGWQQQQQPPASYPPPVSEPPPSGPVSFPMPDIQVKSDYPAPGGPGYPSNGSGYLSTSPPPPSQVRPRASSNNFYGTDHPHYNHSEHQREPTLPDPYLQARYSSPLPLPPGSGNDRTTPQPPAAPAPAPSGPSFPVAARHAPPPVANSPPVEDARVRALRMAEEEAARKREQERKDAELARQLDMELNL